MRTLYVPPGPRIKGADHAELAAPLKTKYDSGTTIRALAAETGRSYCFVHRILTEARTTMHGRGTARTGPRKPWKKGERRMSRTVAGIGTWNLGNGGIDETRRQCQPTPDLWRARIQTHNSHRPQHPARPGTDPRA